MWPGTEYLKCGHMTAEGEPNSQNPGHIPMDLSRINQSISNYGKCSLDRTADHCHDKMEGVKNILTGVKKFQTAMQKSP